ncbi:D-aspartate oxidase-like [Rhopilema esculentum]|uniref:D-aspartate oxidase-like n=1 Tax=Rhopilema esculentum TaxID=499914 RepID=UPI0031D387DB|eukprot:gene15654-6938_t
MVKIAVIGAGIIGLSSAYVLKTFNDHLDVTLFAEKFSPNTTSDGAAGIFKIDESDEGLMNTPEELISKWATGTCKWYKQILKTDFAPNIGISNISGYFISDKETLEMGSWSKNLDNLVKLTEEQLAEFGEEIRSGYFISSVICESSKYLPWLLKRFKEKNGKVIEKRINSFDELIDFDIIVNCSGVGARDLTGDKELVPLRGQLVRVKAPWIRHFYHVSIYKGTDPYTTYIYPNIDNVVLGTVSQQSTDYNISEKDSKFILNRAGRCIPSLKKAEIVNEWVGLRPSRLSSVRLEKEEVCLKAADGKATKKVKIVHNYGHGPCGITLHWGCAQNVLELVKESLEEINGLSSKSKL